MAAGAYDLISLADFKLEMGVVDPAGGNTQDAFYEAIIVRASQIIEDHLDYQVVTRGALVEEHTINDPNVCTIRTRQRPIIAVTAVYEDTSRTFSTALTVDEEYLVDERKGTITRISGSVPLPWQMGHRVVRVAYSAGYAALDGTPTGVDAIPSPIEGAAGQLAVLIAREIQRKSQGMTSYTDVAGNVTKFKAAHLMEEVAAQIERYRRKPHLPTVAYWGAAA